MEAVIIRKKEELEAGLDEVWQSPKDNGELRMIVRRPRTNEREILSEAQLDMQAGLVGDCWLQNSLSGKPGEVPELDYQLTIMNSRAIQLIAGNRERWSLAGDQLYIDLDISDENLPPGTKLSLGSAIIQVTDKPHNGCRKFLDRYGAEALKFVNSENGRKLHLRGIYARVVKVGVIRTGDRAKKTP
jgi:hypothetical protein